MDTNKNNLHTKGDVNPPADNKIALDDERRVRVLSPSMLVFKRFIRNKLAITGTIFIVLMFLFSFIGGWVIAYGESQIFTKHEDMSKEYAGVSENTEFRYTEVEGTEFPLSARAQFVLAVTKQQTTFSFSNVTYTLETISDRSYRIYQLRDVALASVLGGNYAISLSEDLSDPGFQEAFTACARKQCREL